MQHPYIFLELSINSSQMVTRLGPWLRETKQGMWRRQLQVSKQTRCIGWLLFSAPEYNLQELRRIIKDHRADVALRYCTICRPTFAQWVSPITQTKAIHVEVDSKLLALQCQSIASMYSLHAQVFPLAIKMCFVPEFNEMPNHHTHTKVLALQACQARFLAHTGTSRMCTPSNSNLNTSQMIDLLQAVLQKHPYFNQTTTPIFHAISPMVRIKGFIIQYLPQNCSIIQEILVQIPELLPGFHLTSVQSISQPRRHQTTAGDSKLLFPTGPHLVPATTVAQTDGLNCSSPTQVSKLQEAGHTATIHDPNISSLQEAIEQIFWLRFTAVAQCLSPMAQDFDLCSNIQLTPSGCGRSCWQLIAYLQQFFNTAWDWWQYRLGILPDGTRAH